MFFHIVCSCALKTRKSATSAGLLASILAALWRLERSALACWTDSRKLQNSGCSSMSLVMSRYPYQDSVDRPVGIVVARAVIRKDSIASSVIQMGTSPLIHVQRNSVGW